MSSKNKYKYENKYQKSFTPASFDETMLQVKTNTNTNNCYHPPSLLRQQQTQSGKEDINAKYKYEYIVAPACFVGQQQKEKGGGFVNKYVF